MTKQPSGDPMCPVCFKYLSWHADGKPCTSISQGNTLGFVSREKPFPIDWDRFNPENTWPDETEVEILRGLMFFHAEQKLDKDDKKITLGKLREFFTEKSIILFEKDGYIKINPKAEK